MPSQLVVDSLAPQETLVDLLSDKGNDEAEPLFRKLWMVKSALWAKVILSRWTPFTTWLLY